MIFFVSLNWIVRNHAKSNAQKFIEALLLNHNLVFYQGAANTLPLRNGLTYTADHVGQNPSNANDIYVIENTDGVSKRWETLLVDNQLPIKLKSQAIIAELYNEKNLPEKFKVRDVPVHNEFVKTG